MLSEFQIADLILNGFNKHFSLFQQITHKAHYAFSQANWQSVHQANSDRICFYDKRVNETILSLKKSIPDQLDKSLWLKVRATFQNYLQFHPQAELAESFYNSVFCRLFHRRYFNNDFIFVETTIKENIPVPIESEYQSYFPVIEGLKPTIKNIIEQFDFKAPFIDLSRDIKLLVNAFLKQSPDTHHRAYQMRFDILKQAFYRNKAAYIIGRVVSKSGIQPFIIPILHHKDNGLYLDALLTDSTQMRVIFGFARAYFMVDTSAPSALVQFLNQLMPNKTPAELYSAIGFHKQGKTQFYRELHSHLKNANDKFIPAPGTRGMVMMVFTLPSFPYVFKVIRDKFGEGKPFGRKTVLQRYQLVKQHDRVGRMADTIEYSNVALPIDTFCPELLQELKETVGSSLEFENDLVIIKHLYIERRMTPLNLYLQKNTDENILSVMDEYGKALKDMISVNIFPGDMLLKNFGVTDHNRVIFYDYDEVQYLTDMNFRKLPKSTGYNDYLLEDVSVSVAPQDVFPEQLTTFVTTNNKVRSALEKFHPELTDVQFWKKAQYNINQGYFTNIYPYPEKQRFMLLW
ncbi:bifunctional isocitrate dehydrogenase kinase/phosphatase [Pseudoalteromonas denitrificans]|uniref:Isocitrate dehydrogenase kinase/phosphatase n=1 Tax=Pseudoalteromonas denitrificans DSM 6059 TaxID=1123010 RepID=A0A1I1PVB0_9GAMM|nr:bifunctional isocitrate dehydrogenase kinase/phosphatase [Pseudoalteromonas denitrificans]SFD13776.1 isocitrate dehydrogenase kinase/phosphatase [Pseudoalteromonas denitrificans DSM 6059]